MTQPLLIDRIRQLREEINSQPNEKWVLLDRKEVSSILLRLELQESILLGQNGWNGRRSTD
jgi:hypothetical protein